MPKCLALEHRLRVVVEMKRIVRGRWPLELAVGTALALGGLRAHAQVAPAGVAVGRGASGADAEAIIASAVAPAAATLPSDVGSSGVAGGSGPSASVVPGASTSSPINSNLSSPSAVPGFSGTASGVLLGTSSSLNSPSSVAGFSGILTGGSLGTSNSNLSSPSAVPPFNGSAGASPAFIDELPQPGLTP